MLSHGGIVHHGMIVKTVVVTPATIWVAMDIVLVITPLTNVTLTMAIAITTATYITIATLPMAPLLAPLPLARLEPGVDTTGIIWAPHMDHSPTDMVLYTGLQDHLMVRHRSNRPYRQTLISLNKQLRLCQPDPPKRCAYWLTTSEARLPLTLRL
jgi:hypothetical protein